MIELLKRLRQRKIVQWAIAYVAFAFALIQVVDVVADRFGWPAAVVRFLILAFAIGFFVVAVLAWYHGERGAQRIGAAEMFIITLLLVIGGIVVDYYGPGVIRPRRAETTQPGPAVAVPATMRARPALRPAVMKTAPPASPAPIPAKSIAVLPFVNESGDPGQRYFSDGLSDDLTTALAQFAGLKVISRNSAFQFRDSKDSSAQIGVALGVAHLLEGTVQRSGNVVRVTATLVNAADGSIAWSQRYNKPYKDLFALQDAITHAVAGVLQAKLLAAPGALVQSDRPPSGNLAAYTAYQHGIAFDRLGTEAGHRQAIGAFREAVRLDPHYALAYAKIAGAWANLAGNDLQTPDQYRAAYAKARRAVATALQLEPNLAAAHAAKAGVLAVVDLDWTGAAVARQRAAQLAPNNATYKAALGFSKATLGQPREAVALLRHALVLDPLCTQCYSMLEWTLPGLGDMDAALHAGRKSLELNPALTFNRQQLAYIYAMRGDAVSALREARREPPGRWHDLATAIALQVGTDRAAADASLQKVIDTQAGHSAYQIAEMYALRRDPDNMFKWLERAGRNHDAGLTELLTDPPILRYRHDPRFAAFCKKVGLPTTTDAVAMK